MCYLPDFYTGGAPSKASLLTSTSWSHKLQGLWPRIYPLHTSCREVAVAAPISMFTTSGMYASCNTVPNASYSGCASMVFTFLSAVQVFCSFLTDKRKLGWSRLQSGNPELQVSRSLASSCRACGRNSMLQKWPQRWGIFWSPSDTLRRSRSAMIRVFLDHSSANVLGTTLSRIIIFFSLLRRYI